MSAFILAVETAELAAHCRRRADYWGKLLEPPERPITPAVPDADYASRRDRFLELARLLDARKERVVGVDLEDAERLELPWAVAPFLKK